jgi:hypothetical protein
MRTPYREPLPLTVDEWTEDGNAILATHARASHDKVIRAAYAAACEVIDGRLTLRFGAQVIEERPSVWRQRFEARKSTPQVGDGGS